MRPTGVSTNGHKYPHKSRPIVILVEELANAGDTRQQVNAATAMRKILLAINLLSIAVSENILVENHPRLKTAWICDKQLWTRRTKRIPRKGIPSKTEESLNYEDDRQFPRISDTRFTGESRKLPSMVIRRHDLARFSQDDLSFDKSKLDSIKPRVLISIGIQEEKNAGNDIQEDCSKRKNYYKHNQGWQIQQPFYVEEPTWVDIDIDSSQRADIGDPYILTRGKKIYRIKNPEQVEKAIEDYEANLGYPSRNNEFLIKSRARRSAKTNKGDQDKTTDVKNNQIKERNHYDSLQDMNRDINNTATIEIENNDEKSSEIDKITEEAEKPKDTSNVFIIKYEEDDLTNLAKRSLRGFKFTKKNQIFANSIITDLIQQKQKIQHEDIPNDIETGNSKTAKIGQIGRFNNSKSHFATNINKKNKKSMLPKNQELPETLKKREIYKTDANSKKDIEQNETYERMKLKAYVNELNDPGTLDNLFISSRNKIPFHDGIESSNEKDTDRNKSIKKAWKLYYAHRKKLESKRRVKNEEDGFEINKNNIETTDSHLINVSNSKNSEIKTSNYREKRNACKNCKIRPHFQRDEWMELMDIEKKIQESLSLERRDKHSDILERLTEPYIISRGKRVPQDFGKDVLSSMLNSQNMNDDDRAKIMSLSVMESLLRTLLMETSRCNNDNCDINVNQLSKERLLPRDRRGTLDEIFAAYDPYYMARGKRMNRHQKGVPFESAPRQ